MSRRAAGHPAIISWLLKQCDGIFDVTNGQGTFNGGRAFIAMYTTFRVMVTFLQKMDVAKSSRS
jgi:hypothetical protein